MILKLLLAMCSVAAGEAPRSDGSISGVVLNASDGMVPAGGAEVMLRLKLYGQFAPVAQTTADPQGRFRFQDLAVGDGCEYLPGANHQGIHYPGPRIQLTPGRPRASVELAVHDSVAQPSPLVIRRHEIIVRSEPGVLHVSESMLIANPSSKSFVGQSTHEGEEPVTLRLAVPSDFERLSFQQEFFGRRFSLVDGKLVTSIPWTPGDRELKFTYVLRNTRADRVWERPLDLPCAQVFLSVQTAKPEEVRCNLPRGPIRRSGDLSLVTFQSSGRTLPAGNVIRLELGALPLPWTVYGKWLALLTLVVLITGAGLAMIGPVRRARRSSGTAGSSSQPSKPARAASERRPHHARRNRRRGRKAA
jgi:hypothetical protein